MMLLTMIIMAKFLTRSLVQGRSFKKILQYCPKKLKKWRFKDAQRLILVVNVAWIVYFHIVLVLNRSKTTPIFDFLWKFILRHNSLMKEKYGWGLKFFFLDFLKSKPISGKIKFFKVDLMYKSWGFYGKILEKSCLQSLQFSSYLHWLKQRLTSPYINAIYYQKNSLL